MVFVKVRETYDLHTLPGKMSVLAIHTPKPEIIIKNYPGLLMQCKAYRPVSADVTCACASMLPADPLQVGTDVGDVAPEDLFNPILYKAISNLGMSQIEARIHHFVNGESNLDIDGSSVAGQMDGVDGNANTDDFSIYYGLLADTNSWKHANPQAGFSMRALRPLVTEMLYSVADQRKSSSGPDGSAANFVYPTNDGSAEVGTVSVFKGHSRPMPFLNCTVYNGNTTLQPGFVTGTDDVATQINNAENVVPAPQIVCGCVIIPPSRLHKLYYRMVVEWTLEFSAIRSLVEITNWTGVKNFGLSTYWRSYNYSEAAKAAGLEKTVLQNDVSMASANIDINKVM